ncbi:MAG: Dam family site-specific DNA-(adenine-N6)-methyltransferase [Saprospiraceae bacterium]|nr:Dam family site-specific DNA-(adenine-N6)-methyltransferase [Candidatus Opimibacter iunctus]
MYKTCWNGLYRVNNQGQFNVPYGLQTKKINFNYFNLKQCSNLLNKKHIRILNDDFETIVKDAVSNDLIYFDPPYVTTHNNNGFLEYNENIFSWKDQERLYKIAIKLKEKGCHVIISNANHYSIKDLYADFKITEFERKSTLASNPTKRRMVSELIIT